MQQITTYVKKLNSQNPNKYIYLTLDEALFHYEQYQSYFVKIKDIGKPKTFYKWLKTEI